MSTVGRRKSSFFKLTEIRSRPNVEDQEYVAELVAELAAALRWVFLRDDATWIVSQRAVSGEVGRQATEQITEVVWDDRQLHINEGMHIEIAQNCDTGTDNVQLSFEHLASVGGSSYRDGRLCTFQIALRRVYGHMGEWERANHLLLRLYNEKQSILESNEDVETFRFALQAFPRLHRVSIANNCPSTCAELPRYCTPLLRLLPSWLARPWPCSVIRSGDRCDKVGHTLRGYHAAVREISTSSRVISEFVMEPTCGGIDIFDPSHIFNTPKEDLMLLIMKNNLTTLEYTLDGYIWLRADSDCNVIHKQILRMTFACATALEHFTLNMDVRPFHCSIRHNPVPLLDILPLGWGALHSLSFRCFVVKLYDFIHTLSALPSTIKSLRFHRVHFLETTWEIAFYHLRDVVGWGWDTRCPLPTVTVSLLLESPSHRIVILRDEVKRFFEQKAPNPFTSIYTYSAYNISINNDVFARIWLRCR
ncbi:hypothetical protein ACJ72_01460 [Emergomyces africanus]|uniref:Uncharacterized protein n=1 Tax=Emergomyces africanus TaxID=1955775 RepID=A0A1B7P580_9EURO|nr:hypothetical protein ACJ72_01460 [Emergomyces africanus]